MKIKGNLLVGMILGITLNLWLLSKGDLTEFMSSPWQWVSQLFSLWGTVMMAITFWLSTRLNLWEDLFGGLDKVNRIHHILGGLSTVMLVHHPLLLLVSVLPDWKFGAGYVWLSANTAYSVGVLALYSMILVMMVTFLIDLPYELWIKSHDFIGITLFLASLHIYLISSDVSRFWPLRMWIFLMLATAIFSFIYKVFLYKWIGPKYSYKVKKIEVEGDLIWISLEAMKEKMRFKNGQFAFVKFKTNGLDEFHPYSMMSTPEESELKFGVKAVGDYTLKLKNLTVGVEAVVMGPNGRFGEKFEKKKEVVLIAGGIGATPIVSLIKKETAVEKSLCLFYCARSGECGCFQKIFEEQRLRIPGLKYFEYIDKSYLTAEEIEKQIGSLRNKLFFICGPEAMMKSLANQLQKLGVKKKDIIYESFSFK